MKKTEKILELSKQLEQLDAQMTDNRQLTETLSDAMESEYLRVVTSTVDNDEDFEEVKNDVNLVHRATRKIGQRFFNLFRITFTVQFAGVTLIHWTIPKVDDEGQIINR